MDDFKYWIVPNVLNFIHKPRKDHFKVSLENVETHGIEVALQLDI